MLFIKSYINMASKDIVDLHVRVRLMALPPHDVGVEIWIHTSIHMYYVLEKDIHKNYVLTA